METRFGNININTNIDNITITYNESEYFISLKKWNDFCQMHPKRTWESMADCLSALKLENPDFSSKDLENMINDEYNLQINILK